MSQSISTVKSTDKILFKRFLIPPMHRPPTNSANAFVSLVAIFKHEFPA